MTMDRKIRVLIVVPNYYPFVGGIETLIRTFLRSAKAKSIIEPLIVFPDRLKRFKSGEHYQVEGVNVLPISGFGSDFEWVKTRNASELVRIWASVRHIIQDFKPNIVHVNGIAELTVPFLSIAQSLSIKTLAHIHGEVLLNTNRTVLDFVAASSRVLVVSEAVRNSLLRHEFDSQVIEVIVNGVSPHLDCKTKSLFRDANQLIMAGRLDAQKGFIDGLKAFHLLLKSRPNLKLVIVGAGSEIQNINDLVKSKGITKKVRLAGPLSLEQTRDYICTSSLMLVPSRNIEGFGLVAAEAGMCGVPVVATQVGGLPETVIAGRSGLLVEPNNPVAMASAAETILTSSELAQSFGRFAKKHISENFGLLTFTQRLLLQYSRIMMHS